MKARNQYKVSGIILIFFIILTSCSSDIDIKQEYDFNIRMQKYRSHISVGETKELEFFIDQEGEYENEQYSVSVFLRSGSGTISDGTILLKENVYYDVSSKGFKLYYTSESEDTHKIELIVRNSFGNEEEIIITLSNK